MNKLKLFLTVLSILIAVTPITVQIIIHRDNIVGLILPPTIADILTSNTDDLTNADSFDFGGSSIPLPMLVGTPILYPNNTVHLTYTFTNPLDGRITITSMDAKIVCTEHRFILGDVYIEPATLEPNQTLELNVTCILSPKAIEHISTQHQGQDSINAEFENFSVGLTDITITMDHRKLGPIQIPQTTLILNNLSK
ncbi:MAG: hypothetical protein LBB87_03955 [Nitrososphaerota archaeon]|jgi:hypothetical protein|nr:hypothetical protein [Nitrososphaerota archaeon]